MLCLAGCVLGRRGDPLLRPLHLRVFLPQPEHRAQPGRGRGLTLEDQYEGEGRKSLKNRVQQRG